MDAHHKSALGMAGWLMSGIEAHIVGIDEWLQAVWYVVGIAVAIATYALARSKR